MYQTARTYGNDGNSSVLTNGNDSKKRADHSADARNEMHFQPQASTPMSEAFSPNGQQPMMSLNGGLKV